MVQIFWHVVKFFTLTVSTVLSVDNSAAAIAKCELDVMRLGTEIADVFNSPIGDEDWNERVHQDFIAENLGFAPWIVDGVHNSGGLTLTKGSAKELQAKNGWIGKPVLESPYSILHGKWIYMFGDSTTRQVWASFAAPFQANKNFERNSKEWSRQYCNKQEHRTKHVKGGSFPEEGWRGPCGANEVTCHVSGYGEGGLLTYDWKHFPFEDYDEYLFGEKGPWFNGFHGEGERRPELLTLQMGLHSCWHTHPEGLYSTELKDINETMIERHLSDIEKLMAAVRKAVDASNRSSSKGGTKTVIVVTSGSTGMGKAARIDECILKFNRMAANAAHAYGFAVLERGELERRLMFKSIQSASPYLTVDMHLPQPAQNIIATCLLKLMSCLSNVTMTLPEGFRADMPLSTVVRQKAPMARPLHVPPPS